MITLDNGPNRIIHKDNCDTKRHETGVTIAFRKKKKNPKRRCSEDMIVGVHRRRGGKSSKYSTELTFDCRNITTDTDCIDLINTPTEERDTDNQRHTERKHAKLGLFPSSPREGTDLRLAASLKHRKKCVCFDKI